jgi:hypothetical protein
VKHIADQESKLISLHSEWIGESQMRIRVRYIGKARKLLVDVWELCDARHRTSMTRARTVARAAARLNGAQSMDMSLLLDFETNRKATRFDGTVALVRIRQTSFAFASAYEPTGGKIDS